MKRILVIDIGGTHVKLMLSRKLKRKFDSDAELTPKRLIAEVKKIARDWRYDAIALGFPAPVRDGRIALEPRHLGPGWAGFDYKKAFGKPVRLINDGALQALGSYHGGRMLFLGLGTGVGSALIWEKHVLALELCDLPFDRSRTIEEQLGKDGLKRLGKKAWTSDVVSVVRRLKMAMIADYVVLGGGNSKVLEALPEGAELGHNRNAYRGGIRLWQVQPLTRRNKWNVI